MTIYENDLGQRFFELQPTPCVQLDGEGRVIVANPAFGRAIGRSSEELAGTFLLDLLHEEDRSAAQTALGSIVEKEVISFASRVIRPDGQICWLACDGVVFRAEAASLSVIANDISLLRQAESQTRERERFLDTLLSNLPGMVYRCRNDPNWTVTFVSAGCKALTGYPPEDMLEGRIAFGELIHPDDAGPVWDGVQEGIARRGRYVLQYRIYHRSGELRWVEEQGGGVFSPEGELLALEGFISDVSVRVRAENELRDKLRVIEEQRAHIQSLSLPIIEVWDGVLTLPVMGVLDDERVARIMEGLLEAVVRTKSRHIILDLTAIDAIDAAVAEHLLRIVRAVKLLGARGVLAGIQPAVARALVSLPVDLASIPSLPDLRGALLSCLR